MLEYWIYLYMNIEYTNTIPVSYPEGFWDTVIMFENGWQWTTYVFFTMDNICFLTLSCLKMVDNGQHMFSYLKLSLRLNVETWVFNRKYQCIETYISQYLCARIWVLTPVYKCENPNGYITDFKIFKRH